MRKLNFRIFILVTFMLLLSGCGSATNAASKPTSVSDLQRTIHHSSHSGGASASSSVHQTTQSNIQTAPDPTATRVIRQFYQNLGEQKYSSAVMLLGPQLQFEGSLKCIKCLKNIKKTAFLKLEDISNEPGAINPNYSKYYAVKVYYGELNIQVRDPALVPSLEGMNERRFILIKKDKKSSWLIDTDEDTPRQ